METRLLSTLFQFLYISLCSIISNIPHWKSMYHNKAVEEEG